ncbi:hypothetical protein [Phytohabitans kaempferiae]|uniref:Uncharacterized protein n=1 Tax=Phytohabitans kaempferiae TaxID=1620943 RepID=A0ABV6M6P5_9ACTN
MRKRLVRGGLALLGVLHLSWGVPATLAPRWFFDNFPGLGHAWTAAYPPYNTHLVTDLGATFITLGVLLMLAAWLADRKVTAVVLCGVLVFSSLHLAFHLRDHGELTGLDLAASLGALALGVVLPATLLVFDRRERA